MQTRYTCQAVSHEIYPAEDGKAPQIGVELRVIEGTDAGKSVFWYGSLHENAQEFTATALRNMGWTCNDITELTGLGDIKCIAVEKAGGTYVDKRTGATKQGKPSWMIFPVKTPKPTLEVDAKATFAAQYKALAAATAKIDRTELNAGLAQEQLPLPLPRNGSGANAATDGPDTGGVPF